MTIILQQPHFGVYIYIYICIPIHYLYSRRWWYASFCYKLCLFLDFVLIFLWVCYMICCSAVFHHNDISTKIECWLDSCYLVWKGLDAKDLKNVSETDELILYQGFAVPHTNSYGHSFRSLSLSVSSHVVILYSNKSHDTFGIWFEGIMMLRTKEQKWLKNSIASATSTKHMTLWEFLSFFQRNKNMHVSSTHILAQAKRMRKKYSSLDRIEMSIWECCELLNEVVDESDPDLDEPQIQHLLQSAEAIRKDYPNQDWLHLTALIHGYHLFQISQTKLITIYLSSNKYVLLF